MHLPVYANAVRRAYYGTLLFLLICLIAVPASASVFQLTDVTTDEGIKTIAVNNQYGSRWNGIILPFIGGFGEKAANEAGSGYYEVYDFSEFNAASTDCIGEMTFKFNLPDDGDFSTYLIPVTFTTNSTSQQFYIRITQPGTNFMNNFMIEILNSEQTSLLNTTVAQLGSSSPAYVTFGNNKVKLTHVNTLTGILTLWETETGSSSLEIPYSYCNKIGFDISGYPYPVECRFKILDAFETAKTYDSLPLKIYWLISQIIPDNNQNLYYLFLAVDQIWSVSIAIVMLFISMPFMWFFFAFICALGTVFMKGSISSGIPAGIKTFVKISLIPVKIVQMLLEIISRLITAIKPL